MKQNRESVDPILNWYLACSLAAVYDGIRIRSMTGKNEFGLLQLYL